MMIKVFIFNIGGFGVDLFIQRIQEKQKKWKYKIVVLSGKGGVGKSIVVVNFVVVFVKMGYFVGILDVDIYGLNVVKMFGVDKVDVFVERMDDGRFEMIFLMVDFMGQVIFIKVMSMGFFVLEDQFVIWCGFFVIKVIKQFFGDIKWGEFDFMIIDFLFGIGDEIFIVIQSIFFDVVVIVIILQEVVLFDIGKVVNMMKKMEVFYIVVVENMSYFICLYCGNEIDFFGRGGGRKFVEKEGVEFFGEILIDFKVREVSDVGILIVFYGDIMVVKVFMELVEKFVKKFEEMKGEKVEE